ncbi:hypothetical protein AAG570_006720 [Ranatra chinensis]|uniref:Arrestin C-terminal-like domain-containing protein n=1 Tax=Ranatra chinensis TaxID=642074 RepID=A0ABD0YUW7_9HEMI
MGLKNFSIVLDSPTGAFYAGTVVSGRVLLSLDKPKTIRALNVKIEGVAKVSFRDEERVTKSDGDSKTVMVDFTAEEEYFSTKFKLAGRGTGETEIPIGEYSYPFSYTLPPLLPSSFEGEYGSIRYSVKAVIDRPWKFDHETKTSFIVVAPLDLNYNANAKDPVKIEDEKNFCCFCCTSGPLQLVVSLPHSGYVAGQSIPLTIEVDNASNVEVDKIICKLKKEMKWIANNPRRNEKRQKDELVKLSLEGVRCNGSKSWTQQLTVPSDMPFVNFEPCSIIGIDFSLKVSSIF